MLRDISTLTGGQVIAGGSASKLDQISLDLLGQARRVVVTKDNTTIIDGAGDRADVEGASTRSGRDREDRLGLGP